MTSNLGSSIRKKNGYLDDDEDDEAEVMGKRGRRGKSTNGDSPPTKLGARSKSRKSVVFEDEDNLMRTKGSPSRRGRTEKDRWAEERGNKIHEEGHQRAND